MTFRDVNPLRFKPAGSPQLAMIGDYPFHKESIADLLLQDHSIPSENFTPSINLWILAAECYQTC